MKKAAPYYAGFLLGVLAVAGAAYWFWVHYYGEGVEQDSDG